MWSKPSAAFQLLPISSCDLQMSCEVVALRMGRMIADCAPSHPDATAATRRHTHTHTHTDTHTHAHTHTFRLCVGWEPPSWEWPTSRNPSSKTACVCVSWSLGLLSVDTTAAPAPASFPCRFPTRPAQSLRCQDVFVASAL